MSIVVDLPGRVCAALGAVVIIPPIFLFVMMQIGAITAPYWDHWWQVKFFIDYYDNGAWFAVSEIATNLQQHARPVVVRLLFLLNAVATGLDLRSEYAYLYGAFLGTLVVLAAIVGYICRWQFRPIEVAALSVLSVLLFSPASHNTHWWSWMLQLAFNNLLSVAALALIASFPRSWKMNAASAVLCWLSVYTLTNGLILVGIVALIAQYGSAKPLRPSPVTFFWATNIALICLLYFPIADAGLATRPGITDIALFTLLYLGNPISSLVLFQYRDMFQPHEGILLSATCGVFVCVAVLAILARYRAFIVNPPEHFRLLLAFAAFAFACAVVTAFGRSSLDSFGILNGNSSRYVLTGSFTLYGLLFFYLGERQERIAMQLPSNGRALIIPYGIFLVVSTVTYVRSVPIYLQARDFNRALHSAFVPNADNTPADRLLYPKVDFVRPLRRDLLRLRAGPYFGETPAWVK